MKKKRNREEKMKKILAVFVLFCATFIFAACGGDGTTRVINEQNSDDSTAETDDSDADTSSDDSGNQNDEEFSDSSDSADDSASETDTTSDDADSADSVDDGDTVDPDVTDTGETVGETRVQDCSDLPKNAVYNTVSAIVQTWDGEKWIPSSKTEFNMDGSETECRFKCDVNYGWNGSKCDADTKNVYCDEKPANSEWNDGGLGGTFSQTWNGTSWIPANHAAVYSKTPEECGFVCALGYLWDGSQCETAPTQTVECTGLPPVGAEWNTASSITQSWDGEKWVPESTTGVYNETASSTECRFKCKEHYTWNNSQCIADTKTAPCINLPTNGQWNTAISITQTWSGTEWQPSTDGVYNKTPSETECRFVCKPNYKWVSSTSKCDPETNIADCTGKPANTVWNGTGKFEQTWNGEVWYPETYEPTYNKTAGTCTYICDTGYSWNGTSCAVASTRTAACQTPLPENTEWNTVDTITQTYDGSDWYPSTISTYNPEPSESECRYKCASGYNWNGSSCGTTQTQTQIVPCTGLPTNAEWNTTDTITQTWDDYLGTWVPSSTGSFNENPSGEQCRFKCKENYSWVDQNCVADTRMAECTDNLPENAEWTSVPSILQTWDGAEWLPPTTTVHNNEASETECRYKCKLGFNCTSFPECSKNSGTPCYDSSSGLTWSAEASSQKSWPNAKSYCSDLTEGGLSDWRLPNIDELMTLLIADRVQNNCQISNMNNCLSTGCWTCSTCTEQGTQEPDGTRCDSWGTTYSDGRFSKLGDASAMWSFSVTSNNSNDVWVVYFNDGSVWYLDFRLNWSVNNDLNVRCVR